jgi:hypothetical protein
MNGSVIIQINGGNTADFQTPFGFARTAGPKLADTIGFLARLGNIAWVESGYLILSAMFFYNSTVESEKVKILFKLLSVTLFAILRRVLTVKNLFCSSPKYMTKDEKSLFYVVSEGFSKMFAIIPNPYLNRDFSLRPCFFIFNCFKFSWA